MKQMTKLRRFGAAVGAALTVAGSASAAVDTAGVTSAITDAGPLLLSLVLLFWS
jgi:hypothetical protein